MVIKDIFSETKATGPFGNNLSDVMREHYLLLRQQGKQIGNINEYPVLQAKMDNNTYIIGVYYQKLNTISVFVKYDIIELFGKQYINIILMHSLSDMSNLSDKHRVLKVLSTKNLLIRLIEFMKSHYKLPLIDYEGWQSNDAIRAIKLLSRKYKVSWLNIKTGEINDYDRSKENIKKGEINQPFRSKTDKTDWRIIMEGTGPYNIDEYPIHDIYMSMIRRGFENKSHK